MAVFKIKDLWIHWGVSLLFTIMWTTAKVYSNIMNNLVLLSRHSSISFKTRSAENCRNLPYLEISAIYHQNLKYLYFNILQLVYFILKYFNATFCSDFNLWNKRVCRHACASVTTSRILELSFELMNKIFTFQLGFDGEIIIIKIAASLCCWGLFKKISF